MPATPGCQLRVGVAEPVASGVQQGSALRAAGFTEVRGKPPDMAELAGLVAGLAARC